MKQTLRVWADLLDNRGNRVAVLSPIIAGHPTPTIIDGPIPGIDLSSYTHTGATVDRVPNVVFRVPMSLRRNLAIDTGSQIKVYEMGLVGPVAWGVVTGKSESPTADGHWAEFTCPDVLYELMMVTTGSGMVFGEHDTVQSMLSELVARQLETPWIATYSPPASAPAKYDGLGFSAYFSTVIECLGKIAQNTGMHWRRGGGNGGREIVMSPFGSVSPIHLAQPPKIAQGGMYNPSLRMIQSLDRTIDGTIVNTVIPVGQGNGVTQMTLRDLSLDTDFVNGLIPGYNPAYPIYWRQRQDNGGIDGREYLVIDPTSQAKYRIWERSLSRTDIAPISNAPTDKKLAAATLYVAAVTYLQRNANPRETIRVTTVHNGDLRYIGGQKVRVKYFRLNEAGQLTLAIDADYYVMTVTTRITDNRMYDEWELSSIGEFEANGATIISGALQTIDAAILTPAIYPTDYPVWTAEDVGPTGDIVINIPGGTYVHRTVSAVFNFYCQPIRHTVGSTTDNAPHAHAYNVPAQSVPEPAHILTTPDHTHQAPVGSGTSIVWGGESAYVLGPSAFSFRVDAKGSEGGFALYQPPSGNENYFLAAGGYGKDYKITQPVITYNDLRHSHALSGTTADTGGGVPLSAQRPTSPPTGLTGARAGFGNNFATNGGSFNGVATVGGDHLHPTKYEMVLGPSPTGVQVLIDGRLVWGPFNSDQLGIDLVSYLNDQSPHTMVVKAATLGRVQVTGLVRRHSSTVAK